MEPIKPHWAWFFAGPVVLILGCVAAVVVMVMGTLNVSSDMQRVDVPGEGTVNIQEAGESTIFFEQPGVAQATIPEGLIVEVTPAAGGDPLPLISEGMSSFTYNNGNVAGRNYRSINFPAPGQYRVTASLPPSSNARGQVAMGGNPGAALGMALGGFFGIGLLSFLTCIAIVIVVAVMRGKSAKRIRVQQHQPLPRQGPPPGAQTY
jgi:hypothetical protein